MALGFAGPLALVQIGFSKITEALDNMQKKRQEAIDFGISGVYDELKAREQITAELEKGYGILLAQRKLAEESADRAEKERIAREEATKIYLETEKGKASITTTIQPGMGSAFMGTTVFKRDINEAARDTKIQAEALKTTEATVIALNAANEKLKQQKAAWDNLAESINQYNQQLQQNERSRKQELEYVNRIKKAQSDLLDLQTKQKNINLYGGSSQAQAGGGIANEQATLAASQQRMIQAQEEASRVQEQLARENIQIANQLYTAAVNLNNGVKDFTKVITEMPTSSEALNVGGASFDINSTF